MTALPLIHVDGLPLPVWFSPDKVKDTVNFHVRDDDLIVCTYVKAGTTWIQYIIWSIQNHGAMPLPSRDDMILKVAPYLERHGTTVADTLPSPRHLRIHLPFKMTPYNAKAKYVYVGRNPGDVLVSFYYFVKHRDALRDLEFDSLYEQFISGDFPYGDYFDHLLGWFEHKNDDNVLFLLYEDMLADHRGTVLKVAKFISDDKNDYVAELMADDGKILNAIVENTTFNTMKKSVESSLFTNKEKQQCDFFRKGVAGDRHNHLTEDQAKRLKEKMDAKLASIDRASLGPHYN